MKIVWIGDAGCNTGFARVTHGIGERLVRDFGHELHVIAANYDGDTVDTNMKLYYPKKIVQNDIIGQSRFLEVMAEVEPEVVVILNDPNVVLEMLFSSRYDPNHVMLRMRPIVTYVPIDSHNSPPRWYELLHKVTQPVAMSKWGVEDLGEGPHGPVPLVYHGVDHEIFYQATNKRPIIVSTGDKVHSKTEAKKLFGIDPDTFLVLRVDKNSGRKDFAATWKACVPFARNHSNVRMHFHCQRGGTGIGVDLDSLFNRDPDTADQFGTPAPGPTGWDSWHGWPERDLAALYNAADVFISTSRGEGFGLTLAEAAACGLPIVAQNVSAISEVVGPGGILIDPAGDVTVPSGKDLWLPDVPAFSNALERLYLSKGLRRDLGEAGRKHVQQFTWDAAATQMNDVIQTTFERGEKANAEAAEAAKAAPISGGETPDDGPGSPDA